MNDTLDNIRHLSTVEFLPILSKECEVVLLDLLKKENPKYILEIGTCVGYSSSMMLLNSDAIVDTIELDEERQKVAKSVWEAQGLSNRVNAFLGDANIILKDVIKDKEYDFVFLDGPKSRYLEHLQIVLPHVKQGGIILADDVLFFGLVKGEEHVAHKHRTIVRHLREFLDYIEKDESLSVELINEGNGIAIIRKK